MRDKSMFSSFENRSFSLASKLGKSESDRSISVENSDIIFKTEILGVVPSFANKQIENRKVRILATIKYFVIKVSLDICLLCNFRGNLKLR